MGDIYSGQEDAKWRAEELRARNDRAFRDYERDREEEYGRDLEKADWNRMEADIERLTKERDEAREVAKSLADSWYSDGELQNECEYMKLQEIVKGWGHE